MKQILLILAMLMALPGCVSTAKTPVDQKSRLPNILFLFADDQRNDTLSCAGHAIVETPTIDRLAANGVRFENMFVTRSTCHASRTTILTGLTSRSSVEPNQSDRVRPEAL
ncbi:MAG: sulfatase-like hydrolase/transferase, partial [Chloroflexi bacterium]|nr:sulfatase-like hydrolase/transferase [Chloroflexota bacterium]